MAAPICMAGVTAGRAAERQTMSLDGVWRVAESVDGNTTPTAFPHQAPVPGLTHLARPAFPHIDEFDSREALPGNRARVRRLLAEIPKTLQWNSCTRGSGCCRPTPHASRWGRSR